MDASSGLINRAPELSPAAMAPGVAGIGGLTGRSSPVATGTGFQSELSRVRFGATNEQKARAAAEEFVATALVKPVLARMREGSQAAAPFAPGPYEKQFGPLIDNEIAKRLVQASRFDVVDAVARNLLKNSGRQAPMVDTRG